MDVSHVHTLIHYSEAVLGEEIESNKRLYASIALYNAIADISTCQNQHAPHATSQLPTHVANRYSNLGPEPPNGNAMYKTTVRKFKTSLALRRVIHIVSFIVLIALLLRWLRQLLLPQGIGMLTIEVGEHDIEDLRVPLDGLALNVRLDVLDIYVSYVLR